jgi:hypothetical protein
LFDGDNAVLHNTVRGPSRRGHRSLPAAADRLLCCQTLSRQLPTISNIACPSRLVTLSRNGNTCTSARTYIIRDIGAVIY